MNVCREKICKTMHNDGGTKQLGLFLSVFYEIDKNR